MNQKFTDYVIQCHKLYWNMLGNMRGIQNRSGAINWLSGDVFCTYHVKFNGKYEKTVAEIAGKMEVGELPDRLVITPDYAPSDVDICSLFLSREGFNVGTDFGMFNELSAETIFAAPPKNINLFRVNEIHQLKMSGAILNSAFEYDLFSFEHYLDAFSDPRVRFYIAEYIGNCGILVGMAEQDAITQGKLISVLSAFPGGVNAYSRIGYEKCCEFKVVVYNG